MIIIIIIKIIIAQSAGRCLPQPLMPRNPEGVLLSCVGMAGYTSFLPRMPRKPEGARLCAFAARHASCGNVGVVRVCVRVRVRVCVCVCVVMLLLTTTATSST